MTSKHTPGPWSLDGDGVRALVRDASGLIVAVRHRMPGHKNETNMRLIAAAPELLEALESILSDACDNGAYWDKARAAIAKATGAQP